MGGMGGFFELAPLGIRKKCVSSVSVFFSGGFSGGPKKENTLETHLKLSFDSQQVENPPIPSHTFTLFLK